MKRIAIVLAFVLVAMQAPAFAQDLKIAVINTAQVVATSEAGKHGEAEVQKKVSKLRAEVEKLEAEFKTLVEDYKRQQAALSVENRRLKELEIKRRQNEIKELYAAYRQADQSARREVLPAIHQFLEQAAAEYLEKQGYTLVIDQTRGALAFYDKVLDVTPDVIKHCDEAWKAKGN
jgi:outer membrane protein